jgi:outer membrane protein assembly factor BamE (lipoprotein component of BamABCDE complex)
MFTRQGRTIEQRNFTVYFVDDKVARWEGDEAPPSAAELNREAAARTAGEWKWAAERTWWDSVLDVFRQ